jgi:hypothetical protein
MLALYALKGRRFFARLLFLFFFLSFLSSFPFLGGERLDIGPYPSVPISKESQRR